MTSGLSDAQTLAGPVTAFQPWTWRSRKLDAGHTPNLGERCSFSTVWEACGCLAAWPRPRSLDGLTEIRMRPHKGDTGGSVGTAPSDAGRVRQHKTKGPVATYTARPLDLQPHPLADVCQRGSRLSSQSRAESNCGQRPPGRPATYTAGLPRHHRGAVEKRLVQVHGMTTRSWLDVLAPKKASGGTTGNGRPPTQGESWTEYTGAPSASPSSGASALPRPEGGKGRSCVSVSR